MVLVWEDSSGSSRSWPTRPEKAEEGNFLSVEFLNCSKRLISRSTHHSFSVQNHRLPILKSSLPPIFSSIDSKNCFINQLINGIIISSFDFFHTHHQSFFLLLCFSCNLYHLLLYNLPKLDSKTQTRSFKLYNLHLSWNPSCFLSLSSNFFRSQPRFSFS